MKRILAVVWILILCAGLLMYSLTDPNGMDIQPPSATPDMPVATPDVPQKSMQERLRLFFYNDHPVLQLIYEQLAEEFFNQTGIRGQPGGAAAGAVQCL